MVRSIVDFRRVLEDKGHEVYIFAPGDRLTKKNNTDKHVFYSSSIPFIPYPGYNIAVFPFFKELKLRKLGIDVIHTHGMASMGIAALAASRTLNLPIVGTFHTMVPKALDYVVKNKRMEKIASKTVWKYLNYYYNKCDCVIAPSEEIRQQLIHKKLKNVFTVPNGVNRDRFNEKIDGSDLRLGDKNPLFMYLGRVASEKDIPDLIKSMPFIVGSYPDSKLWIVGTGPALENCKKITEELDISENVVFKGFVSEDQLAKYYSAIDVFVTPSSFETEGLSVLEALSCGKPAVGVNEGGVKYLIKNNENGYLVEPHRPRQLAEAMIKAYENRNVLSKGALKTAESLSVEKCTEKLISVYESVLR